MPWDGGLKPPGLLNGAGRRARACHTFPTPPPSFAATPLLNRDSTVPVWLLVSLFSTQHTTEPASGIASASINGGVPTSGSAVTVAGPSVAEYGFEALFLFELVVLLLLQHFSIYLWVS